MKNIFDVNVDANEYDGVAFYSRKVSPELEKQLTDIQSEAHDLLKKISPYLIAEMVLVAICFLVVQSEVVKDGVAGIFQVFHNPVKTLLLAALAAATVAMHMISRKKKTVVINTLDQKYIPTQEQLLQMARMELQIPENCFEVEVLSDPYELVKDWKYLRHKEYSDNLAMDVYQRGDSLCFFSGIQEFAIPFDKITSVEIVQDKKIIEEWHKDTEYNEEPYKKYHVRPRRTNNPGYVIRAYYQILIEHIGQQYEIIVPNYEEEAMRKIVEMVKPYKQ